MTLGHVLSLAGLVLLVGFIVFTFRQGLKVKPGGNGPEGGPGSIDGSALL